MIALAGLELRSIHYDQVQHDAEQALARCQQLKSFEGIAKGINSAITASRNQFSETMSGLNASRKTENQHFANIVTKQGHIFDETVDTIVGGDSFISLAHPLRNIKIQLTSLNETIAGRPTIRIFPPRDMAKDEKSYITERVIVPATQNPMFRIYYDALNGHWVQDLSLQQVNGIWYEATKVRRKNKEGKPEVIYERVDPGFPTVNGKPAWGLLGPN